MTIPTQEIQALRNRAQEALDPLPYQRARLLPVLRCDRPVRFAAVEVDGGFLLRMLDSMPASVVRLTRGDFSTANDGVVAHWPAAQIVELCDAVLMKRRLNGVGYTSQFNQPEKYPTAAEIIKVAQGIPEPPKLKGGLASAVGLFGFAPNGKQLDRLNAMAKRAADRIREQCTPARIKAALLDLPFVDSVQVEENHALDIVDGMPPRSVRVTVTPAHGENGEWIDVPRIIHEELPAGVDSVGTRRAHVGGRVIRWSWSEFRPVVHRLREPRRPLAKVGAIDGVKAGGVDFGTEPDGAAVSTFEMTESGPVLTGVREATSDEVAEMKATFESAEPDGRIHYTDDPPRALKEAMDEAVSAEIERQRATIKDRPEKRAAFRAKLQRMKEAGHRPGQEPTEAERRERLRREMAKGRW